ncbi:MAG: Bifunctional protein HldE [Syntrophomonadaceae bacterium]|nr:Bifunctional protein HldE [Bacillota bacterium]
MKTLNEQRKREIISRFHEGKVLVVGDVMIDEFLWGKVSRISREAPIPVVEVVKESFMLGGAANTANNIGTLGGNVLLSGVIGDDLHGRILCKKLKEKGLDTQGLMILDEYSTTTKTRVIAQQQQLARIDKEKKLEITGSVRESISAYCQKHRSDIEVIVVGDHGNGVITPQLFRTIIEMGKRIIVDPGRRDFSLYNGASIITPNRQETEAFVGMKVRERNEVEDAGRQILSEIVEEAVLITLGEDGMCLLEKTGEIVHIPTIAQEVYDVCGAGDTVVATLALALSCGATLQEAASLANLAAGIVVAKFGTATVSREELSK